MLLWLDMAGGHEVVREPHPPGQSATPRLQAKDGNGRAGRFYSARGTASEPRGGARGEPGGEGLVLPDIDTPTAVLGMVSDGEEAPGIDALVNVRQVKLKSGLQVNLGRGQKVHSRPVHASSSASKKEQVPFGSITGLQKQNKVDEKAERRKKLLAKLPVIENDPAAQKHMIGKINRQLVEAHNELDRLKQQRFKKRERLKDLRDKFADVCVDSGLAPTRKKRGGSTALVVSKGSVDPKMLRMQSELSKLRRKMDGLTEERMAMECMRERMESDWILSVARLREKRTILAQHDGNDEDLTKDYLNQCMLENSHTQGDLRAEKRQLLDDSRKRQHALEGLRMSVALELNTLKMDEQYEERKKKVIAAQAGDLDTNGEKRLKTRVVTGHFRALMINNQSQRSVEEMRKIVERLDRIKEVTGAKDASHLIVRYEELKATNKAMSTQKDESHLKISELEKQRDRCQRDLEAIGEYGVGNETSKAEINGFEQRQRHANERHRFSYRLCSQAEKMVTASRLTVQSMLMVLKRIKYSQTFNIDVIKETQPQSAIVKWLDACGHHLQEMEESLPNEYRTLLNERSNVIDVSDPADWKKADPDGSLHLGARVWITNVLNKFTDPEAGARCRGIQQVVLDGKEVTMFTKTTLSRMNVNELRMQAAESNIAVTLIHSARAGEDEKGDLIRAILRRCAPTQSLIARRVARDEREGYHPAASLREQGDYFYEEGHVDEVPGMMFFMSDENPGHAYRHGIQIKLMTGADLAEQTRMLGGSNNWRIDVDTDSHRLHKARGDGEDVEEGDAIAFLNLNVNADRFSGNQNQKDKHGRKGKRLARLDDDDDEDDDDED